MKRTKLLVLAAATMALGLTACKGKTQSVDKIVAGFESSLAGKLSFSYNATYKVDVDSHTDDTNAMSSFKHDIEDKVTGEIDLTAGDLYLHVKNEAKDKLVSATAKVKEALVYKNGGTYYYLTSTMENPVALASEAAASNKIAELVSKVSTNLAGGVTLDTFVYGGTNEEYEYREFGLSSSTVGIEYWDGVTEWSANKDGGIKAVSKPEYVGYTTDAGVSDFDTKAHFEGDDSSYAALIEVNTNSKGYVTSYSEEYSDLALDFAIMNPAPTVTIQGSRTFSAVYGGDITKLSTINHELTYGTVKFNASNKGTYEVYTCSADNKAAKTSVANEGQVKVGDLLAVKVTPAGSNTVLAVTYGTVSGQLDADGYYYFEVQEGTNSISVNFNGSDENEDAEWATVTSVTKGEGVATVSVTYIVYPDVGNMMALDEQGRAPVGASNFLIIQATFEDGYELDAIKVNDATASPFGPGIYGYNIKEAGNFVISVTAKSTAAPEETADFAWTINSDAGVASVQVMTLDNFDFAGMQDVTSAGKAEAKAGRFICFKVTTVSGAEVVSVKIGDVAGNLQGGFYCFDGSVAGNYVVDVVTTKAGEEDTTNYVWKINKDAGVASVQVMTLDNFDFAGMQDVTSAGKAEAKAGRFICFKVTTVSGANVTSVKCGEVAGNLQGGFYCFDGSVAGEHTIDIVTDVAAAQEYSWTINADAGVESVQVMTLDNFDFAGMQDVSAAGKAEAKAGRFICFKVTTVDGYNVYSVKIGSVAGNLQGGFYCFDGSVGGSYTVDIVTERN